MITAHHGDCLDVIPSLGVTVDAVVTDPPYHLTSGNIAADYAAFGPRKDGGSDRGPTNRAARKGGFMGQQWDGGDVAFRPETWAAVASVMRPGGFLLAFGGTRTYHRLVCAIEDAGFVIQDTIAWLYGSGFPKRRDMLKPAFEPICLAYKPGGKRTMQVDECRIGTETRFNPWKGTPSAGWGHSVNGNDGGSSVDGRWPANVCHDGSEGVTEGFPQTVSLGGDGYKESMWCGGKPTGGHGLGDSGSAARYFYCAKADKQDRWGSLHPTVKPVELIKWLVKLVTPPGGLALDPFAGSGTTGVAALAAGRNAILIERDDQYIADIRERLAFYEGGGMHSTAAKNRSRKSDHGPLFAEPYSDALDAARSYDAAIKAIGERVKAGEPLPTTGYFGDMP